MNTTTVNEQEQDNNDNNLELKRGSLKTLEKIKKQKKTLLLSRKKRIRNSRKKLINGALNIVMQESKSKYLNRNLLKIFRKKGTTIVQKKPGKKNLFTVINDPKSDSIIAEEDSDSDSDSYTQFQARMSINGFRGAASVLGERTSKLLWN